jgi:endogenous inhibitor of DNA gyrase (YacG/DUF329 family)
MRGKRSFLLWASLPLLGCAGRVLARAGGGGDFHGDGGGGFGGGGGRGGGGNGGLIQLLFLFLRFCIYHPAIGLPILIAAVVVFIYLSNRPSTSQWLAGLSASTDAPGEPAGPNLSGSRAGAAIQQIRQHDSGFDENALCERVRNAFMKIQSAWCAQDVNAIRLFCSDGVAERFALQFAEQRQAGFHDQMESISVDDVRVADLVCNGVFDEIAIRIAARAADYRVAIASGQRISGSTAVEPFVEMWSFLRRRGALSDSSKPGLMEGNCPNCGGAIAMTESAVCPHCKALLRTGTYDWVLSEITQESEWSRHVGHPIYGLGRLRSTDGGFDAQAMEDRASVVFWRKVAADRIGKIDPLRKVAADSFCQQYAASLHAPADGTPRAFIGECAVGSVQMLGFVPAESAGSHWAGMELVLMEVHWSGKRYAAVAGAGVQPAGGEVLRSSVLVLGRRAGSQTDAAKSIISAHCPNCGAPEPGDASNACPFCNTVLNDGAHGWVLLAIQGLADSQTQAMLQAARAAG